MEQQNTIHLKTTEGHVIKTLIELLQNSLKIGCFVIKKANITLRMMDTNKKLLIDLDLQARNFNYYTYDSNNNNQNNQINIGVNLSHFHKMIKSIKKKDSIEIYIKKDNPSNLFIKIVPKDLSKVTISCLKIQNVESLNIDLPDSYENSILVSSSEFSKTIKDLLTVSNSLIVRGFPYCIKLKSEIINIFSREVLLGECSNIQDNDVLYLEEFDNNFLSKFLKISGLHPTLHLNFQKNMPFQIQSRVGSLGNVSLYLKSKTQLEEDKYL